MQSPAAARKSSSALSIVFRQRPDFIPLCAKFCVRAGKVFSRAKHSTPTIPCCRGKSQHRLCAKPSPKSNIFMNMVLLFVLAWPHRASQRTAGPLCVKIFAGGFFPGRRRAIMVRWRCVASRKSLGRTAAGVCVKNRGFPFSMAFPHSFLLWPQRLHSAGHSCAAMPHGRKKDGSHDEITAPHPFARRCLGVGV